MGKQSLFKKNVLDIKDNKSWLHNVYVVYFIFIIALGDLYYLMVSQSWFYMTLFILVGFLTSFFSKNMVVILCIALTITNVLKMALTGVREGFEESDKLAEEASPVTTATTEAPSATTGAPSAKKTKQPTYTNPPSKQPFTTGSDDETTPTATTGAPSATTGAPSVTKGASTSTKEASTKGASTATTSATVTTAPVQGFTDGVYTTEGDMEYKKAYNEKEIITNQEKIMKNLNKYKPLLETINSITKNIAVFKS
jgi:hypothetical protein